MKTVLFFISIFFSISVFGQSTDTSTILLNSGNELKVVVVKCDVEDVSILNDLGGTTKINASFINTIDGMSYDVFFELYMHKTYKKAEKPNPTHYSFSRTLEKGGTFIAVGTCLFIGASLVSTISIIGFYNVPVSIIGGGIGFIGSAIVITGAAKISKSARIYREQNLGAKNNYKLQYGIVGNGAGMRLTF